MTTPRLLPSFLLCVTLGLLLSPASPGPQGAGPGIRAVPGQTSTVLPDGRWLLLGGQGPQGSTRTAAIYDPRTSITTALTPLRPARARSEEHTSELQSRLHLVCRLLLEKKKKISH